MQTEAIFQLFDPSDFVTRDQCGLWTESLKWTYILSNAATMVAYTLISASLLRLWKWRREVLGSPKILVGFAGFIAACGVTHLSDVAVFWWPAYRFYTLLDAMTAVLSIGTAMVFPVVVTHLIRLPTIGEFRRINEDLERTCALKDQAIDGLTVAIKSLRRQVGYLERLRRTGLWVEEQELTLRELKALLDSTSSRMGPS